MQILAIVVIQSFEDLLALLFNFIGDFVLKLFKLLILLQVLRILKFFDYIVQSFN